VNKDSIYQVCTTNEEVYVCVKEKASYMNCNPLRAFLHEMVEDGNRFFVIDFQHCSSMDSTFLGILVGLALQLRKHEVPGKLTLINLVGRNLETVQNLGIHKIATVSSNYITNTTELENLNNHPHNEEANPEIIYKAHKTLLELNEKNSKIFRDVVNYLEQKIEDSA
jgi:anti-anti-sigma regulatory factor